MNFNPQPTGIKTLHIVYRLDTRLGGAVHATLGVCKYLATAGEAVEVAGSFEPDDHLDYLESEYPEFRTHRFLRSFPKRYANSADFAKWFPTVLSNFDLIELHTVFSAFIWRASQICRQANKPYFVRPHGSLDPFDLRKHSLLKAFVGPVFVRPMLAGAKAAVLTAELEAQRLVTYGAQIRRVVMPLPVSLPNSSGNGPAFRKRLGISANERVLLFMSRLDYKKGLQFLIPALGKLHREHPTVRFILAGTGDAAYTNRVQAWIDEHQIRNVTHQVGFIAGQDKLDAMAAADVFALPSLNENFGIVLVEAMHAGLPLLISNEIYISREIEAAGAGLVCQPEAESVLAGLRRLFSDEVDLRRMGDQGKALVAARYRPESSTELLLNTYAQTLNKPRPMMRV